MKTLNDGVFQFYQYGLIYKVFEATVMHYCNELPTLTNVEALLVTDDQGTETKRG